MSLISMEFLLFVLTAVTGYYLIPKKYQWIWLLVFSYIYYASAGVRLVFFLVYTTVTAYAAGKLMERAEEKQKKKRVLVGCLLLNFGMLSVLKYTDFVIDNLNKIFHMNLSFWTMILPLGISFYIFQAMGYILDVYWGRCKAEKNFFRFALFVSFFPQILQGPIGRYHRLSEQLYEEHAFHLRQIQYGLQLMLWGFFKKLVLADRAAVLVNQVSANYMEYTGVTVLAAVLMYSVQLYMDFSGGMNVVEGVAELFGIELDRNFKRPYFAVSITDFWHRWHITLGTWMKDYVFYPVSLSKWMGRFGKWSKAVFGKKTGRLIPISLANVIVFLLVGVWHGAAWKYIVYGLYNGLLIAAGSLLAPVYQKEKKRFHISDGSKGWRLWQISRTFILVNISWYFDIAPDLAGAFQMMKNTLTDFRFSVLRDGSFLAMGLDRLDYIILFLGCTIVFIVSVLQERGVKIRETVGRKPMVLRWLLYGLLVFGTPMFGHVMTTAGGFIYAQF